MKNSVLILLLVLFGCSSFTYKDLILPDGLKPGDKSPESMTAKQVKEDAEL